MSNKILFNEGKITDFLLTDINGIIGALNAKRDYFSGLKTEDILIFFGALSIFWKQNERLRKRFGALLKPLCDFTEENRMKDMLNLSLRGNYKALDGFVDLGERGCLYTCHPRGLAVHWLAGNVPLLGLYSILQAMATKNSSLVKSSGRAYEDLVLLLDSINEVKTDKINGSDLIKTVSVVAVDRNDLGILRTMSENADIRIAWGGKEAIESVNKLKKKLFSEDIIFGPKYSYAIIGKEETANYKELAKRLAFDVSVFDQYACASPHTVFVESGGVVSALEFAEELGKCLDLVNKKMIRKSPEKEGKRAEILSMRAKYSMLGSIFSSSNCDWTVVYTDEDGLAKPCFSRVVFVKPIDDLKKLASYNNNRKIQTVGFAVSGQRRDALMRFLSARGVDRYTLLGNMTFYGSPWDGFFAIDRMVRWVTMEINA